MGKTVQSLPKSLHFFCFTFPYYTTVLTSKHTPPHNIQTYIYTSTELQLVKQFQMATQLQISSRFQQNGIMGLSSTSLSSCLSPKKCDVFFMIPKERRENSLVMKKNKKGNDGNDKKGFLCSKLETVEVVVGEVTEVDKDTFWPLVNAAGDKIVVLDMYTQWCGPCKIIAPKLKELAQKYSDVVFLKMDCNQDNKALAKELGIKVVPTFKFIKDGKIVNEVTGAKLDRIVSAIEDVRST